MICRFQSAFATANSSININWGNVVIDQLKGTRSIALHATSALAHRELDTPPSGPELVSTRSIIDLPGELIAKILSQLGESSKLARSTCRKFDLSFASYRFKAELNWPGNPADFEFPSKDRFCALQILKISGPWFCFPVTRWHAMPEYQSLKTCEFSDAQGFRNRELEQICKLPNLKTLHLDNSSVNDIGFNHLLKTKKQLVSLSLTRSQIRGRDIDSAARPLLRLTYLDLSGSEKLTDVGLTNLIGKLPNLRTLKLTDCNLLSKWVPESIGSSPESIGSSPKSPEPCLPAQKAPLSDRHCELSQQLMQVIGRNS